MVCDLRHTLTLHPDSHCDAVSRVEAEAVRGQCGAIEFRWFVSGRICDLLLPPAEAPVRADELWRHTCFEAFVRPSMGDPYYEFNFAPSRKWAAYRFDGYRIGMRVAGEISAPEIAVCSSGDLIELRASLSLPATSINVSWPLGLSAVIEEKTHRLSYWALRHPTGKPDFHHPDGFTIALDAA